MSGNISLTASMRANLLSLQNISKNVAFTQNNLSTGLKVNSAIDNPSSYYTAKSLTNRANDLNALLDSMGQAISTIQAATTTLEAGFRFLEQATAVATQVMEKLPSDIVKITKDMSVDEIQAQIKDNIKLILAEDVIIKKSLLITAQNVKIDGNGHKITFRPDNEGEAAIYINNGSVEVTNLGITSDTDKTYGIQVVNNGSLNIDNIKDFSLAGMGARSIVNGNPDIFEGKSNTLALVTEVGDDALAAQATYKYYPPGVTEGDVKFGATTWYLPSIGEIMQMYGLDENGNLDSSKGMDLIKNTFNKIGGVNLYNGMLATSSEVSTGKVWFFHYSGYITALGNGNYAGVRAFNRIDGAYNPLENPEQKEPKVGDIMYKDGTWGSSENYVKDINNPAVGVISNVSVTGDITIVSLGDMKFSSNNSVGNFTPSTAHTAQFGYTTNIQNSSSWKSYNVDGINDYNNDNLTKALASIGSVKVNNVIVPIDSKDGTIASKQFTNIISQYDSLMKDGSYKGVNLLTNESLNVRFNEDGTSVLEVSGKHMSAASLGIKKAEWMCQSDVAQSLKEIANALGSIRSFQTELGNNFSILSTRQDFTENLINVLTEGSDKLTLADMNEESANMLALQTRQQLAVNSLSLASQATQSILKVF